MGELIVVNFDDKFKADEALLNLLKLEQAHLSALEDAVVVIKNGAGNIRVKAYHDLIQPIPELSNELWGGVISGVVFHRSLEIAQEVFDGDFLVRVEEALQPNTSALLVLVQTTEAERVVAELAELDGKLSRATLPEVKREKLTHEVAAQAN
jgi:uncharacterized membrane protein